MMKRRQFALNSLHLAAAGAATAAGLPARAQGEPVEGREYTRVQPAVPVLVPGKIEVAEFFGYWCPHCNAFEPALEDWAQKLPGEVNLRRVPVVFGASQEILQKMYYALESMGLVATLHRKVFAAYHVQHIRFDKDADVTAFATANGVDPAKLLSTLKSFSVATKCTQARQFAEATRIDGVPTLVVQGRYLTSVGQAGGPERALAVTDALIQKAKRA